MLSYIINADSKQVTAEQYRALVDVGVRIIRDAARGLDLEFTIGGLHASAPTLDWQPQPTLSEADVDAAFSQVVERLNTGVTMLEDDAGIPDWMAHSTAKALWTAGAWFQESAIDGISFGLPTQRRDITRKSYRTLDRVLHEETHAIGSVTGVLVTATLRNGSHVTITDDVHGRGVICAVTRSALREAGPMIGDRVTVYGRIQRDYIGRPARVASATVEAIETAPDVSVAAMGGAFEGGPDSVEWLRSQRGG